MTVTALKIAEWAQTVPIAITALAKELKNSTIRDITDLNGFAPNVQIGEDDGGAGRAKRKTLSLIRPIRLK